MDIEPGGDGTGPVGSLRHEESVGIARAATTVRTRQAGFQLGPLTTATNTYLILKLQRELGVTSIVVSHDIRSAFRMASKIALLANKRIEFFGTPEEMTGSEDPYIREFLGGF